MRAAQKTFRLPMTASVLCYTRPKDDRVVAHSLDFDLVAVSDNEEKACNKLRLAIKTYVEYGISNCWTDSIAFPAPIRFWEQFEEAGKAGRMKTAEPIGVNDDRMIVVRATMDPDGCRQTACTAPA